MLKKSITALALTAAAASALAADYYIVVPFKKAAAAPTQISVGLNSLTLAKGVVGVPYGSADLKTALQVSGDANFSAANVSWTIDSGALPAGLSLGADGVISGTPTEAGADNFTVRAAYKTASGSQTYELIVINLTVSLSASAIPNLTIGQAYSFDLSNRLTISGDPSFNASNVQWSLSSGTLPEGLTLNSGGILSGVPKAFSNNGTTFSLKADYLGKYAEQSFTVYPKDSLSVGALLHFNGSNGSAQFVDEKGIGYTSYGATISTAQSKFGGASGLFNGTARITSGLSNNFYFPGDFTFEGFIQFNNISNTWTTYSPSNQYILDIGGNGTYFGWRATHGWSLFKNGVALLSYQTLPDTNKWYHFAVQRSGTSLQLYIDGQLVTSNTFTDAIGANGLGITLGNFGGGGPYGVNGYLDEFRITPSAARYSGNFTVPAEEYPSR